MQKTLQKNFFCRLQSIFLKSSLFLIFLLGFKNIALAQTTGSVGIGTTLPYANAILDITSTEKGLLIPRLTAAQRDVLTPKLNLVANGLLIYNVTTLRFNYWNGTQWNDVGLAGAAGARGADGTVWYAGQGVPPNSLGKVTDFYLDAITGDVYQKDLTNIWIRFGATNPVNLKNANKREVAGVLMTSAAGASVKQNFAFAGALVGNAAICSPSFELPDGVIISYARVIAADVVEVKFYNTTGVNIPAGNYQIAIIK
ncbi:hypothetical protein [Pedobacter cryophilus]|uniref:Uncharacterized protein n=1 Tax=Pedobacter cryophilus TaxID=2571271 RepID=A0A4U1C1N8_9SPHI|nr:hypothetical protein [Pedobacter cryophilus]TKB98897.1 hypothetical protein FA046_07220 [Pedobacter cryophilus]